MITFLSKHFALLQKLLIALFASWSVLMLVLLWFSGDKETDAALQSGKRFVLHVDNSQIEGRDVALLAIKPVDAPSQETKKDEKKPAIVEAHIVPQMVEAPKEDLTAIPPIAKSQNPIADILPELSEKKDDFTLPRVGAAGQKSSIYYAKTFKRPDERPLVAIIVTGLGLNRQVTQSALALHEHVGMSFSPYSRSIAGWLEASRVSGHESYIDVPMQTSGYPNEDPGPYAVLLSRSNTQNLAYLQWAMSRAQGYVGLFTPVNGVMTTNSEAFKPLVTEMEKRGVILLLGHEPLSRETKDIIDQSKVSDVVVDVWIDEELSEMGIQSRLATLEQTAQHNGYAVGVVHAYPISIIQLKNWLERVGERDYVLAPPSFIEKVNK